LKTDEKHHGRNDATFFSVTHAAAPTGPRLGRLRTGHGEAETPCFLPVASHGTLRAISFQQAVDTGTKVLMANAWHVYRSTTPDKLREIGGAHRLLGWDRILFTDSGGYQVFSLREGSKLEDEGVSFAEETEALTPLKVIQMQRELGSDIMIALDDCAPYPCEKDRAEEAVRRTTLWGRECMKMFREIPPCHAHPQYLYGIVQGSVFTDLRRRSIAEVAEMGFDGYGIGGLSIGMPRSDVRAMTALTCELLPQEKPRHLLGVGLPPQILEGIADGADTFDCVLPVRKAQRGTVYTRFGEVSYKEKAPPGLKDKPLDPKCACPTCAKYSREQLRVLYRTEREVAGELATIHNLHFYHHMLQGAREAIRADQFATYLKDFNARWNAGEMTKRSRQAKRR
jgi:queuine tRNA-ribosyltransferase